MERIYAQDDPGPETKKPTDPYGISTTMLGGQNVGPVVGITGGAPPPSPPDSGASASMVTTDVPSGYPGPASEGTGPPAQQSTSPRTGELSATVLYMWYDWIANDTPEAPPGPGIVSIENTNDDEIGSSLGSYEKEQPPSTPASPETTAGDDWLNALVDWAKSLPPPPPPAPDGVQSVSGEAEGPVKPVTPPDEGGGHGNLVAAMIYLLGRLPDQKPPEALASLEFGDPDSRPVQGIGGTDPEDTTKTF